MTTRREHHCSSPLNREEPPSTAAGLRRIALRHHPNRAKRPTQPQCQSGFPAGSKRKLEFECDWQRRRIKKVSHAAWNGSSDATVVTTKFIYDGWNLLAELDSSNNVVRSYVWGTDLIGTMQEAGGVGGLLFVKESDGTPHFVAHDGNGNVMGLVKGTDGTRTSTYEYDPFGQPLRATGSMALANPMRFSAKFTDNETGLMYYGYRYYNPSLGRWLNRDPIEEQDGPSLIAFVANQPISQIDINGQNLAPGYRWPVDPDFKPVLPVILPSDPTNPRARYRDPYTGQFCKSPLGNARRGVPPYRGLGIPSRPGNPQSALEILINYTPMLTRERWYNHALSQCYSQMKSSCYGCCIIALKYGYTGTHGTRPAYYSGVGRFILGPCPDPCSGYYGALDTEYIYERI